MSELGLKPTRVLLQLLSIWVIYTVVYVFCKHYISSLRTTGILALIGELGLDIVLVIMCFKLSRTAKQKNKVILLVLMFSYIFACFSDGIYNFGLNILLLDNTTLLDSLYDIPFVLFLALQAIVWILIFKHPIKIKKGREGLLYLPYFIVGILIFSIFMFTIHWKLHITSLIGIYQVLDTICEAIGFSFAAICLIRARTVFIQFLGAGYLTIVASDFIIRYGVISNHVIPENIFETTWVLGLLLSVGGLLLYKKKIK